MTYPLGWGFNHEYEIYEYFDKLNFHMPELNFVKKFFAILINLKSFQISI